MALRGGSTESPEVVVRGGSGGGGVGARRERNSFAFGRRLVVPMARNMGCAVAGLTILTIGGFFAGAVGLFVAGMLLVYGIPVWGFTRNQRRLAKKGSELATSVGEVQELIHSDAAAFRRVITAIFPWRSERDLPAVPDSAHRVSAIPRPRPAPSMIEPASRSPAGNGRVTATQPFWLALSVSEQGALTAVAWERIFEPDAVLCLEGQPADHVIVIRSGWTKVCVEGRNGQRIIARRGPGELIGERAALRKGSRSATVIALETVHTFIVATEDFAAFLEDHPRILDVLERQIYGRLTEERSLPPTPPPPPAPATFPTPSVPSWRGQNCSILFTDIAAFSAHIRSHQDRRTIRRVMYRVLREAFENAGVQWTGCHRDDRGDGVLVIVPPSTPTSAVVNALLTHLAAGLQGHNRRASDATRIQLRVALDVGPVVSDPEGVSGNAIIQAARLLESPILKRELVKTTADLGFIVSSYVYDNVITDEFGLDGSAGYQQVRFQVKESRITAWMHLTGTQR